jgi:hypothetical protein
VERSFIPSFAPIPPQNEKSCETKIVTLVKWIIDDTQFQ